MPKDQCNICASRFATFPHFHMAGNMWTAQCSYIQQLIPPKQFPQRMEELMEYVMIRRPNSTVEIPKPTFKQMYDGYPVGRERFAYEHWLGSHPHLKPCDVYPGKYLHGYRDLPDRKRKFWIPRLGPAPRWPLQMFLDISMLRGEWFCGQARLFEFEFLYGLQPKENSFIWSYYYHRFKDCEIPLNRTLHLDMYRANGTEQTEVQRV
jgi:hypothetical protein